MSGDSIVREPRPTESDPFGDVPFVPTPTRLDPTPLPEMRPTPSPEPQGGILGGLAAWGAARVIGTLIVIGIGTSGFGLFVSNLGNSGPPNVPTYILDACYASLAVSGDDVAYGAHYAYEQAGGGDSMIRFRGTDDSQWDCRWSDQSGIASIENVALAP